MPMFRFSVAELSIDMSSLPATGAIGTVSLRSLTAASTTGLKSKVRNVCS